jgi:TetR/AcrR family transcriptional regulator
MLASCANLRSQLIQAKLGAADRQGIATLNARIRQREATRGSILQAALEAFSERGFDGVSTREIAARAGVHHALIKYHYETKDKLWRAAVIFLFTRQAEEFNAPGLAEITDPRAYARELIRRRAYYWARHPEHARLMVQESCADSERFRWMTDHFITETRKASERFILFLQQHGLAPQASVPALAYIFVGAAQLFYTLAPEVRRVWNLDPADPRVIEDHVEALVAVLIR